ncbi:MAG: hypothetical protein AAF492_16375 [Verrucomicrobiota bacterium]
MTEPRELDLEATKFEPSRPEKPAAVFTTTPPSTPPPRREQSPEAMEEMYDRAPSVQPAQPPKIETIEPGLRASREPGAVPTGRGGSWLMFGLTLMTLIAFVYFFFIRAY